MSWNKGIKQWEGKKHPMLGKTHSDETRKIISKKHKGKHHSPETEFKKGHNLNKGKHSKNEFTKKQWADPIFRENQIKSMKNKWNDQKYRDERVKIIRKNWSNPKFRENMIKIIKERWSKTEFINKRSEQMKKQWENSEYRDKVIKYAIAGLVKRPTSLEKKMINIIEKNNLPYKYVGDGSFLIGYKNPDFVNVNGEKICIEVANFFHHKGEYEKNRTEHFAKYGWKTIVIWENEFDDESVILKKIYR